MHRPILWTLLFFALWACVVPVQAAEVQDRGSVSFAGATILTPDAELNAQLREGKLDPSAVLDIRVAGDGLNVNPLLRKGWTWMAARDIRVKGKPFSFFFVDGRLYS